MNIKGKTAIVTGASSGIGKATAEALAKKGVCVVLAARSIDKLKTLEKQLPGSMAVQTDMTDKHQVEELIKKTVQKFNTVDILINNAGRGYDANLEDISLENFNYIFNLNLLGPIIAMKKFIPVMKKHGGGTIINISSGTALMFLPGMGAYSSLKRALVGISLTAREELKKDKITVSVMYPYITETDFEKNTLRAKKEPWDAEGAPMPGDSADHVADKIIELIESGKPEGFAHDWMGKR